MKIMIMLIVIFAILLLTSCSKKTEITSEIVVSQNQKEFIMEQYNAEEDFDTEIMLNGEAIAITKYNGKNKNVRIPPYIKNLPVLAIRNKAFYNNKLVNITIPDGLMFIGDWAFASNKFTEITIPDSVSSIGAKAFYDNKLTNIIIPSRISQIGESAFESNQLVDVTILDGVNVIRERAFYDNKLTNIIIPNSMSVIREFAFAKNRLVEINIPNGVLFIGEGAFSENNLSTVIISATVTTIKESAFALNNITKITIPDSIFIGEQNIINAFLFKNGFNDYYLENGSKAGTYTYKNGRWNGILTERQIIETDGIYEIIAAYSHLYGNPYGVVMEIETKKLGMKIPINNNKVIFDNAEYQLINRNSYNNEGVIPYREFLHLFASMDYGSFDINIIGNDYTGIVKAMTMENNTDDYYVFFADNKLIIMVRAYKNETEFEHLIKVKQLDSFFYIAEKLVE